MNTKQTEAQKQYNDNVKTINDLIERLQTAVNDHGHGLIDYGDVGDLTHVRCRLEDLVEFMRG